MCKGERSLRTNIQVKIKIEEDLHDEELRGIVDQARTSLGAPTHSEDEITLYLTFSENSNPVYRIFPNLKRPKGADGASYSRLERRLFDYILSKLSIHYIPSEKSISDLYNNLVMPVLFERMHKVIAPHLEALNAALNEASDEINRFLKSSNLNNLDASFRLPNNPEDFFRKIEFNLKDNNTTSVFQKGMGIQSAVLLSSFCWIAQKEKNEGKLSLWLLEEPESYLHPELATQCIALLDVLSQYSQIIVTTHSLGFVPQDPTKAVGVTLEKGWTKTNRFKTYFEATSHIRQSLGVRFSDFYNFSKYNILVEGSTDRMYLDLVINSLKKHERFRKQYPILFSQNTYIHDFGGVKGIEGFLKATHEFIRKERASICILDGDDAGDSVRRSLQNYFSNKNIPFAPNVDFVVVRDRFAIEGLLPDKWVKEAAQAHPGWFDSYSEDAQGTIMPFKIKDGSKNSYLKFFSEKIMNSKPEEWTTYWKSVLDICEKSLSKQSRELM
ncbi:AAA family ATPase [Thalassobaculum sp. OXR-137]|uniref:ATP-dependent nuclease n=1 Tax=Thalassobaculum sp. OXR-137 TaxID=3100173 RepID=UPI002AC8D32A|nr:AAA family ATPase [Thalassobaculum sp. OXR-137]WPZ32421.1 AAA family ATPase [Thalassobaculum sp. OXR-137]